MQPPYAKIIVRLDGGAPLSGGITSVEVGQTVQLSVENPTGLTQYRWEIYDYPPDFALPAGWQEASDGTYYSTAPVPPSFAITHWGTYLLGLYGNESHQRALPAKLTDYHRTALCVASPTGLVDLSFLEKQQFHLRGWPVGQKQNLRRVEELLSVPVREIAGTSHTLELDDRARQMRSTNVSDTIITVPPQSSVAWPENARVPMLRLPAGRLTIAPGAGVTITTKTGFEPSTLGPVGAVMLERVGEDQWVLYGDLEEST